jgi:catechol 2,3-dioxygenase-like lactoylglutathione lyase family enzyme
MPNLHHTGLTISDLERSLRFWRHGMGMDVLFEQEKVVLGLHRTIDLTLSPGRIVHRYQAGPA